jgi:hypothetical protein
MTATTPTATATDTTTKSYLFLDVDGILNPFLREGLRGDWRLVSIGRYDVWQSEQLSAWLNDLLDQDVQIVWATTWVESPEMLAELAEAWHLPTDLPRIHGVEWPSLGDRRNESGKQRGVAAWLAEHDVDTSVTPVVWVDDDLGPKDQRWAAGAGVTCVKVNPWLGLYRRQSIDEIEQALSPLHSDRLTDATGLACPE